jgi:hypothetical protein
MPCNLTQGFTLSGCKDGIGGLLEVYFIEKGNVSTYVKASGTVTALTKLTGKRFYKYELQRNTAEFKETIEGNPDNGTVTFKQELSIVLNRLDVSTRNEILLLAQNNLWVVIKNRNGGFQLMGEQLGSDLTKGESGPGKSGTDRSGHTLTFTAEEPELAAFVNSTVAAALTTPG